MTPSSPASSAPSSRKSSWPNQSERSPMDLYRRLRTEARRAHPGRALLLAVAAFALTGLVGGALVVGSGILPSPAPSLTPSPSPDATSSASPAESSAGAHVSAGFQPAFAYTLPTGWHIDADEQSAFVLTWTASGDGANNIEILSDLYPPVLNDELCQQSPQWERPHAASDLLAYLTSNPALSVLPRRQPTLAAWPDGRSMSPYGTTPRRARSPSPAFPPACRSTSCIGQMAYRPPAASVVER